MHVKFGIELQMKVNAMIWNTSIEEWLTMPMLSCFNGKAPALICCHFFSVPLNVPFHNG